jgi:hypothetical protein
MGLPQLHLGPAALPEPSKASGADDLLTGVDEIAWDDLELRKAIPDVGNPPLDPFVAVVSTRFRGCGLMRNSISGSRNSMN